MQAPRLIAADRIWLTENGTLQTEDVRENFKVLSFGG